MVSEKEKIQEHSAEADSPNGLYSSFHRFGEYIFTVLMTVLHMISDAFMRFIDNNADFFARIGQAILNFLQKIGKALIRPFTRRRKATKLGLSEVSRIRKEKGHGRPDRELSQPGL